VFTLHKFQGDLYSAVAVLIAWAVCSWVFLYVSIFKARPYRGLIQQPVTKHRTATCSPHPLSCVMRRRMDKK